MKKDFVDYCLECNVKYVQRGLNRGEDPHQISFKNGGLSPMTAVTLAIFKGVKNAENCLLLLLQSDGDIHRYDGAGNSSSSITHRAIQKLKNSDKNKI